MNFKQLLEYWKVEVTGGAHRPFSPWRCWRRIRRQETDHFLFWFRLAQYLHRRPSGLLNCRKFASRIQAGLVSKHNIDILLDAEIGPGLRIFHRIGIVVAGRVRAGANLQLRQNTTIGIAGKADGLIVIGSNVSVGPNTCILGDDLSIGDNVTIGAMAFVNRDIPADSVFYSTHLPNIKAKP